MSFIDELIDGVRGELGAVLAGYVTWFIVQILLDAEFPPVAALINFAFVIFNIAGLIQGADDTLRAASVVGFIVGGISLIFSLWLTVTVG